MTEPTSSTNVTFRCPQSIIDSIEAQSKVTGKNKSNVIVTNLLSTMFSVSLSERSTLPKQPAIYFVFTVDKRLLYLGCVENLYLAWTNHPNYQQFNEACSQTRIGYFIFQSLTEAQSVFTTIDKTPETQANTDLELELQQLKKELDALKQSQMNPVIPKDLARVQKDIKDLYQFIGKLELKKTLENYSSLLFLPGEFIPFEFTEEERTKGLTFGELTTKLGFFSLNHFKTLAVFHKMEEKAYLTQISLWEEYNVKQGGGSHIVRWFPSATLKKHFEQKTIPPTSPHPGTQSTTTTNKSPQ